MLREMIESLIGHGRAQSEAECKLVPLSLVDDPLRAHYLMHGEVRSMDKPDPIRAHKLFDLESLITAINTWGKKPTIWVSESQITVTLDDRDLRRNDHLVFGFNTTPVWAVLLGMQKKISLAHGIFLELLRSEFRHAGNQAEVLAACRNITWSSVESGQAGIESGHESMGRTIQSKVQGSCDIPESLNVESNIFTNVEQQKPSLIEVSIFVDARSQVFKLQANVEQMHDEMDGILTGICSRIEAGCEDIKPIILRGIFS